MRADDFWRNGERTVYFEFLPLGHQVKVMAVDAETGIEVAIIGPVSTPRGDLERLALRKLRARIRNSAPGAERRPDTDPDADPDAGPGRLV